MNNKENDHLQFSSQYDKKNKLYSATHYEKLTSETGA